MKIVIGDMSFEEVPNTAKVMLISENVQELQRAENVLQAKAGLFLLTAQACYTARYQERLERSTLEEF